MYKKIEIILAILEISIYYFRDEYYVELDFKTIYLILKILSQSWSVLEMCILIS